MPFSDSLKVYLSLSLTLLYLTVVLVFTRRRTFPLSLFLIPWFKTPCGPAPFLCIRVVYRDIFGEPDVKGGAKGFRRMELEPSHL